MNISVYVCVKGRRYIQKQHMMNSPSLKRPGRRRRKNVKETKVDIDGIKGERKKERKK